MNTATVTLADFLLARIADDERAAHGCAKIYPTPWNVYDRGYSAKVQSGAPHFRVVTDLDQDQVTVGEVEWLGDPIYHVARWNPARVLAECAAKRRIVEWHSGAHECPGLDPGGEMDSCGYTHEFEICMTLCALALPYADHPDYREEWKP